MPEFGPSRDSADTAGSVDTAEEGFRLELPAYLSLPFATAGTAPGSASLAMQARGSEGGEVAWTVEGPFEVSGDAGPLEAGEARILEVAYAGPVEEPLLAEGRLVVTGDAEGEVVLLAVVGDGGLPEATWSTDAWGTRTVVDLPSAPFPYGSASYTDSSVLVVAPPHLSDAGEVAVVTHLHGHGAVLESTVAYQGLVEQHALSGRDALLVVPQGPVAASDGDFGRLDTEGGHADLVRDALSVAFRDGVVSRPQLGGQVLTAHSGGYLCGSYVLDQGGLEIDAVHLFDALYGRSSSYETHALAGGVLRSNYTTSGGTLDDNQALRSSLRADGLTVDDAFDDAWLATSELSIGHTAAPHSDAMAYDLAFSRWLRFSGIARAPGAPAELLAVAVAGGTASVQWWGDVGATSWLVQGSADGESWDDLAEVEADGGVEVLEAAVPASPWVRVVASSADHGTSAPSDRYAGGGGWLVVDGFDRVLGGSWEEPTHDFAARVGEALGGASTAANEAVASGLVELADFAQVVWLLGDESVADATFDAAERAALTAYVEGGGALIVSGSELGYATDASWLTETLHASYVSDDAGTDEAGGFTFGVVYEEDYPDVLSGDEVIWRYATGGAAAVGWDGRVVAVGFALETLADDDLEAALGELEGWLGG